MENLNLKFLKKSNEIGFLSGENKHMIFTAFKNSSVDYDGTELKEINNSFDSPFDPTPGGGFNRMCFVIYQGLFGTYKIRECYVTEVWYTNIWGWRMDNGWCYTHNELGKTVFRYNELQTAIEICEKKNRMHKVKVKWL